jgi:hypothetical protein
MKQIRQLAIALAMFAAASGLSGCAASMDPELAAHLEAERDFHAHQQHVESIYNLDLYDPEHVDDCFYYEELVCEFE